VQPVDNIPRNADFRSDCVTRPTPEMYQAMVSAPVGDDVLGDDSTVKELEALAAQMLGKEAALFVPTGTMGNSICIKVLTRAGDEVLVEELSHIFTHEMSHLAVLSRVLPRPVKSERGVFDTADLRRKYSQRSMVTGRTTLVCIENTHNFWSGRVVPLEHFRDVRRFADEHELKVHLDGARLFNAQVASGVPVAEYARCADTVMFCLSKGLACPIGSLIAGPHALMDEARYVRKMLGGGMRQVGVIAACGIVALETMVDRLADDHRRAKRLAEALAGMPGVSVAPEQIDTNIVICAVSHPRYTAEQLVGELWSRGTWTLTTSATEIRFVTHKDVNDEDVDRTISEMGRLLRD
jgi:threonine aldolase